MNRNYVRPAVVAMTAYTPGEQPRESDILKLNTNENPYPPSPAVTEAIRRFSAETLRLYPDPNCRRLCERVSEIHRCRPEQVIIGNGSDEILAWCVRAFGRRHEPVGWFEPSYSLYSVLTCAEERPAAPLPLGPNFEWQMPETYRVSLFFLTQPNAPTGRRFPRAAVEHFCRTNDGVVVLDEAYADFASANDLDLALSLPNVIAVRTLSKSFSLAGLRLGYAVGPSDLIAALFKLKDSYNVDRLTQETALAALSDLGHMRDNVARIVRTREATAQRLYAMGFDLTPSETNFLWAKPPSKISAQTLFERLRAERIFVRYFPGERTGAYVRITIGTDEQMARLLEAGRRILAEAGPHPAAIEDAPSVS